MKILHTSDWHLGRLLYGRKRYDEYAAFLDWLIQTIEDEEIDALPVVMLYPTFWEMNSFHVQNVTRILGLS